jgi:PIN domain nuclease of toxin-antitoxin system
VKLLLDTHTMVWSMGQPDRLPHRIRRLIADERNSIHVSVVSIWEIVINHVLPRRGAGVSADDAAGYAKGAGYEIVPVRLQHVLAIESLSYVHPDPFDRLLVAQALVDGLRLVTHDTALGDYDPSIIVF